MDTLHEVAAAGPGVRQIRYQKCTAHPVQVRNEEHNDEGVECNLTPRPVLRERHHEHHASESKTGHAADDPHVQF